MQDYAKKGSKDRRIEYFRSPTPFPSGKQRQKKSGRGRPTASLMASVKTAVIKTENRRPEGA
jgi:hypothetical protein